MKYRLEEKLETLVKLLDQWRTSTSFNIKNINYVECDNPNLKDAKQIKKWSKLLSPFIMTKPDTYYWFKGEFEIVNHHDKNERTYLSIKSLFDQFRDGTCRPQGVLYLNDKITQGIDINHYDVLIKKPGHYTFYLHFYTHELPHPSPLEFLIKYNDERVEQAYYDYWTILEDTQILLKDDPIYTKSLDVVNHAMNMIDLRNRDELFFNTLLKSRNYLKNNYFHGICSAKEYTIDCVGNSHIDMAWLWDLDQTHQKGLRTFSSVIKLMDEYPEYSYMHTSPRLFKFIERDNPELFNKIKEKVKEGRFEVDGAMWVEPDCNLTSGESLVRQILYGKSYFKDKFNVDSKTLILPDVFGYCYQLPQILRLSGVNRFLTAKMGWCDTNRFPYDSFDWVGLDGSKIFTYLVSTCTANPRMNIKDTDYTIYTGLIKASDLLGTWNRYELKKYNNNVITMYGFGDGGGGPTREMLEKQRRYQYGLPKLGQTKMTRLDEALDEVENNFRKSCKKYHKTPTWNDELYLEYHRGTYTSVPRIKKLNRDLETSFLNVELLASLDFLLNKKHYPSEVIHPNYEAFLLHQFHDILPGSSIEKVYQDADKHLGKICEDNNKLITTHLSGLLKNVNSNIVVFNPNAFKVTAPIIVNNECYVIKDLPSVGYCGVSLKHQTNTIKIDNHHLANNYFDVKFNQCGEITSIYDKLRKKELVARGETINKFIAYEDTPYQYDNWEISPYYHQKAYPIKEVATFKVIKEGDRQGFKITRKYYKSTITQIVYLYNGINRIDFINQIDWKEKRQLLKIHFPFNVKCEQARYDVQFGSIGRNATPKNKYDEAKFEVCAHKWVDLSDNKFGIALLNDSKYGYSVKGNDLALTALKSGSYPYDKATDICPEFKFALFPHDGNYQNNLVQKEANAFNRSPIVFINKNKKNSQKVNHSFVSVDNDEVILETIKKAHKENAFIFRGYESTNKAKVINIKIDLPFKKAYLTDLMENNIKPLAIKNKIINLKVKPFEIFTIKVC